MSFWSDFDRRFRLAGWGESVASIDYSRLPAKFSSQCFNLGGFAPGQGLSRGDVVDAKLEWVDLPVAENPIPLRHPSPRLKQLLKNREQYMSVEPSSRKAIGKVRSGGPALPVEAGQGEIVQVVLQGKHAPCRVAPARPGSEMLHRFGNKVNFDGSISLRLVFDLKPFSMY